MAGVIAFLIVMVYALFAERAEPAKQEAQTSLRDSHPMPHRRCRKMLGPELF